MRTIVVTRHAPLVAYLREIGLINDEAIVLEHVTAEDIRGERVIGVLPLHLAADAERVTEIPLVLTQEDRVAMQRGDLPIERLREIALPPVEYSVCRVRDIAPGDLDAMETSRLISRSR